MRPQGNDFLVLVVPCTLSIFRVRALPLLDPLCKKAHKPLFMVMCILLASIVATTMGLGRYLARERLHHCRGTHHKQRRCGVVTTICSKGILLEAKCGLLSQKARNGPSGV
eukprot:scaffold798_cov367-Pavlova_lutheri.AAC.29